MVDGWLSLSLHFLLLFCSFALGMGVVVMAFVQFRYSSLTAEDSFGRVEYGSVVSASNLFKLGLHHGLLLFREHHPLKLDPVSIRDGIAASLLWFQAANKTDPLAVYPLLLWNTLPRAGASQFHGHMQVHSALVCVSCVFSPWSYRARSVLFSSRCSVRNGLLLLLVVVVVVDDDDVVVDDDVDLSC